MNITKSKSLMLLLAATLSLGLVGCSSESMTEQKSLDVSDGWVRVSEMTQSEGGMTGAFAVLTNNSENDITLIGAESDVAGMVEVHEVVEIDGEMKMQAIDGGIVIPAGQSVTLEPGGLHIMLMKLTRALVEGEELALVLKFEGHEDVSVSWPTRTSMTGDEEYHSHDGESNMDSTGDETDHSNHDH